MMEPNKQGRPTKKEQEQISLKLQPYYERGFNATSTSKKTRFNLKTVCKYFNKWDKELLKSADKDFLKRCRVEKEKSLIVLDNEIASLDMEEEEMELMKESMKRSGEILKVLEVSKLKLKIKSLKNHLLSQKINLVNSPTLDTIIMLNSKGDKNDAKHKSLEKRT